MTQKKVKKKISKGSKSLGKYQILGKCISSEFCNWYLSSSLRPLIYFAESVEQDQPAD